MAVDALLDTNILLRGLDRHHPESRLVRRTIIALRRQEGRLCITPQNLIEFWVVATRPVDSNGLGMSVQWAAAQLARMKHFFILLPDTADTFVQWERLVMQHQVSGKKAHDAKLVASMKVHGIVTILTFNVEDFARYWGIQVLHPEHVLAELR